MSSWTDTYLSHREPDISLCDHLRDVGEVTAHFLRVAGVRNNDLLITARLVGLSHDFGKYSPFFQRHLRGLPVKPGLASHAAASALFAAWLVGEKVSGSAEYLAPIAFSCVLRHHSHLQSPRAILEKIRLQEYAMRSQLQAIQTDARRVADELTSIGVDNAAEFLTSYPAVLDRVKKELNRLCYNLRGNNLTAWAPYFHTLSIFSALIDADKKDAAQYCHHDRSDIPLDFVDHYRQAHFGAAPTNDMNALRGDIFEDVMTQTERRLQQGRLPRIMTITAPTGSGKTLAGLAAALRLRQYLASRSGYAPPRIIYCLPYINIIEQTHTTLQSMIETSKLAPSPDLLLKHHHLAFPQPREDETIPLHHQLLLQESWDSELVVTTFAQLLYTLVGYRNNFLKKFHNLCNAVIILDEVQALPIDYWFLVRELFTQFAEQTDSYVLFMTATQPLIFPSDTVPELVSRRQVYFGKLDRTRLVYDPEAAVTPEEVASFGLKKWQEDPARSLLVVLNTIGTSIQVYKAIKEQLQAHNTPICLGSTDEVMALGKSSTAPVLAYLSTNIVPAERQRRVVNLIDHLERRPTIVVATQVIEAGVDLDFDLVIRDIGPIDAINQVAGRCNRSGKKAQGAVYVIRMRNEKGKPYAELIYRQMHVRIAEELLRKHPSLPESQFPILLHDYLTRVRSYEGECSEVSRELIEAIKTLHFEELDKFKLIEEEPRELRIPVFIDLDANAKTAKTAFLEAIDRFKTTDRHCQFDRRAELKRRHADIQNYVVEVRERDNPPVEELVPRYGIRYADPERSAQCYDRETGYRRETVHAVIW